MKRARRAVELLAGDCDRSQSVLWQAVAAIAVLDAIQRKQDEKVLELASLLGLLEESNHGLMTTRSQFSIAMALSVSAARDDSSDPTTCMKRVVRASSLLPDHAVQCAGPAQLPAVAHAFCLLENLVSVFGQTDKGVGNRVEALSNSLICSNDEVRHCTGSQPTIDVLNSVPQPLFHKNWCVGDGLLPPPRECLMLGMHLCRDAIGNRFGMTDAGRSLRNFTGQRVAHFQSLCVSCWSLTVIACTRRTPSNTKLKELVQDIRQGTSEVIASLTEHSLGCFGYWHHKWSCRFRVGGNFSSDNACQVCIRGL